MTKNKLIDIINNPEDKLIAVDIDGTLTEGEAWTPEDMKNAKPRKEMINLINSLYERGAHIVIYTAREQIYYTLTQNRLEEHQVKYHGINMKRKPGADVYIDDKALNITDVL